MYINDLIRKFLDWLKHNKFTKCNRDRPGFFFYLRLCILFYADDTVIPAGTPVDLRNSLNEFYSYSIHTVSNGIIFFHVQCLSKKKKNTSL